MIFPTASHTPRPKRLSKETRAWAWESMHGKYGDDAMAHPFVTVDHIDGFDQKSKLEQYDLAVRLIAQESPIRITEQEKISGAATLGQGIIHWLPFTYQGERVIYAVSHLTIDFFHVLSEGIDGYSRRIVQKLQEPGLEQDQIDFLHSLEHTIESLRIWHGRYLDATREIRPEIYRNLCQVPFGPARNFYEAVQSIWFIFAFVRLYGNFPGIGRLDQMLGGYLQKDLADGTLTLPQAREIMASFLIKGCEWIQSKSPINTGDAQHYQNLVLAGVDEQGKEITNEVTYLILDVVEELGISDYPITMRINQKTPEKLMRKIAQVMRHGGGIVAIYHEDLILRSLVKNGYPLEESRAFANDGCWEVQIPGRTDFGYMPFDAMQILNDALGIGPNKTPRNFDSMEEIYQAFRAGVSGMVDWLFKDRIQNAYCLKNGRWRAAHETTPCSVVSLFEEGCIDHAASYFDAGPQYIVRSPHIGGAPDAANSLYAIEKLVFEEKKVTLPELIQILNQDWEGQEELRLYVKNHYDYYGNDAAESDAWEARILNDFADLVHDCKARHPEYPMHFIPGVSTFGRQVDWLPYRTATAFGFKKGEILAGNASPTPGTDVSGATAIIKSYCKADLEKMTCGAALDIKILPDTLKGEDGVQALKALMRGFCRLNGFFMQLDTVDLETLLAAQKNPEAYKTLSVRVSGWNARFITLKKQWQDMIIERNAQSSI